MSEHSFTDTDGDGLCDFITAFQALERRCLQGEMDWPHRLARREDPVAVEVIAKLSARILASEQRAERLEKALREIAAFGQTAMMGYHNAESIEVARAALAGEPEADSTQGRK